MERSGVGTGGAGGEPNTNTKGSNFQFPPGFRFHPSDEELIVFYLQNKVTSRPLPAAIIAEVDLYKYNPWELPTKALFGEEEWYFFSPRDRKYPNGARPNRAAGSGFWKATGTDKPILSTSGSKSIGVKKALVFYSGRPPKGVKTDWIMNEYRLLDPTIKPSRMKGSMRLDDWVLCRVRQKGAITKNPFDLQLAGGSPVKETVRFLPMSSSSEQDLNPRPSPPPSYMNCDNDMIRDCLNQDCRVLASLLVGQTLPSIDATTANNNARSTNPTSNNNNNNTTDFIGASSPITVVSSYDNYTTSPGMKRKLSDDGETLINDFLSSPALKKSNNNNDGNQQSHDQEDGSGGFYSEDAMDPMIGFLELNEFGFSGKYDLE
ncbi:unnamed protein product [Linum tenue]|uniref:NAC domain-containing protein n=1 Tax=Linum tenue TaxID=586396 RepID=A0AAV0QC19_9ROSI|nr:unnamed protein product [Linum tenue]